MISQINNRLGVMVIRMLVFALVGRLVLVSSTNLMMSSDGILAYRGGQKSMIIEEKIDPLVDDTYNESTSVEAIYAANGTALAGSEKRNRFLARITAASSMLLNREDDAQLDKEPSEKEELAYQNATTITSQTDLSRPGRYVHIVTTASLPWMTGTAVNPLLRAAYLHERLQAINGNTTTNPDQSSWVTLVIPWLELPEDQEKLFNGLIFNSTDEQEAYVRQWLVNQALMPDAAEKLNIVFYNARYHSGLGSVFAMGDIIEQLPADELDVCILEEPEHVNWFRAPGQGWTKRYNYVLGIIHTNYDQYATQHYSGLWTAPAIRMMSAAMVRAYCHKVIKLSDALQPFAPEKEVTMNVHGVRKEFIQTMKTDWEVESESETEPDPTAPDVGQVYFIGKLLWAKGLNIMLEYQDYFKQMTGEYFPIDIYGSGPDQEEIKKAYLGRWSQEEKEAILTINSKNLLVKIFTWLNRRKRNRVSVEEVYKDMAEVMEVLSTRTKNTAVMIPSKVRGTVEQVYDDMSLSKESVGKLSGKARKAIKKLAKVGLKLDSSSIPSTFYELRRQPIPARFPGRTDHADLKSSHKIFVNPSVSEVLATTTYEALAMGKFAVIPVHASNTFFLKFPNCLSYRNQYEFVANLQWALTHDPVPLTQDMAREFTWEAATDRLIIAAGITHQEARARENLGRSRMDERIAWFHNEMGKGVKGDVLRKVFGAGPVSDQVKYVKLKQGDENDDQEGSIGDESDDDVEEGLTRKLSQSAFVKAIRQATAISISARK